MLCFCLYKKGDKVVRMGETEFKLVVFHHHTVESFGVESELNSKSSIWVVSF